MCITANIPNESDDVTYVLPCSADSNGLLVVKLTCYQVTVAVHIFWLFNQK